MSTILPRVWRLSIAGVGEHELGVTRPPVGEPENLVAHREVPDAYAQFGNDSGEVTDLS
ncbi:hypothetical protein [Streptomyces sp. 7N604]|uniref:hypothetical protein n=1 Tax=Streptomyces sp. 7N604 TaxID=3457415 RepID=UPI003FD52318